MSLANHALFDEEFYVMRSRSSTNSRACLNAVRVQRVDTER
jgi:hypothetical protein